MIRLCPCGSGLPRSELIDARGIFCTFICPACEASKRQGYRAEIFSDPSYAADEPIEGED